METEWIFRPSKLHQKSTWKKQRYFDQRITPTKVRGNNVDFSTINIKPNKVRGNSMDFSIIEITSKKVRGNDVDFRPAKLHRKNKWKLRGNSSKFGLRRNIHVESTSIQRGVSVGFRSSLKLLVVVFSIYVGKFSK